MKRICLDLRLLVIGLLGMGVVGGSLPLVGQPSANDLVVDHFFAPEFVRQCQKAIALTEQQDAFLKAEVKQSQERLAAVQAEILKEAQALVPLVSPESVDEQKVIDQSEKIRRLESDLKRAQFTLLIRIKNKLTPAQQGILKELMARNAVIQGKLRKAQELAQQRTIEGRNLSVMEPLRIEFEARMQEGNFKEAEVVVDRTLKILESLK